MSLWFHAQRLFYLGKNIVKIAPDRLLTVYGILLVVAYPVVALLFLCEPKGLGLVPHCHAEELPHLYSIFLVVSVFFCSFIPAHILCRYDPKLYARIATENTPLKFCVYFLSSDCLKVINRLKKADPHWSSDGEFDATHLQASKKPKADVVKTLGKLTKKFRLINESITLLSPSFGLNDHVFTDQFLKFNSSILVDRFTKLGLNYDLLTNEENNVTTEYRNRLIPQSNNIIRWIEQVHCHLERLNVTKIDIGQLQAVFRAESTSGSVQRLAYLLQNEALGDDDLCLIFELLGAYRGRSLFRRLLAITVASGMQTLKHAEGLDVSLQKSRIESRIKLLIKLSGNTGAETVVSQEIYAGGLLEGWWTDVSKYMQERRSWVIDNLVEDFKANEHSQGGRLFLVADAYSRAVRTSIGVSLSKMSDRRICLFFVTDFANKPSFSPRLLQHVTRYETLGSQRGDLTQNVEIVSGDIALLKSMLREGDSGVYLTGAAGISGPSQIFTTTPPKLIEEIEQCFTCSINGSLPFKTVALAGSFKLDWSIYYHHLSNTPEWSDGMKEICQENGIDANSLIQERDSLTGGLYLANVDKLFTDLQQADIESAQEKAQVALSLG